MKVNNNNKKGSNAKKIIPAAGMLSVSAVMLASSTFAWFTMSREVEVQNIQMTATVPEDIQISLGTITNHAEEVSLAKSTGYLTDTSGAIAPTSPYDWSNIADISHYYSFGKLIPASSTDGANIFYTTDAAGVGRTMKAGAAFYQAANGAIQYQPKSTTVWSSGIGTSTKATAHINTSDADRTGASSWLSTTYVKSTAATTTNDDGYYMDIPVWLRTSSTNSQSIYVYGYVTSATKTSNDADVDDLYKAVRVAILSTGTSNDTETYSADKGCLTLKDGLDTYINPVSSVGTHTSTFPTSAGEGSILDSDNYTGDGTNSSRSKTNALGRNSQDGSLKAVSGTGTDNGGAWASVVSNDATSENVVATLTGGTGSTFGEPTKLIIRVWLEGEDGNCWNENAGQDWNIALKFSKDPLTGSSSGSGGQQGQQGQSQTYTISIPAISESSEGAGDGADAVTLTYTRTKASADANWSAWATAGTWTPASGKTYKIGGTTMSSLSDITDYVNTKDAAGSDNVTVE